METLNRQLRAWEEIYNTVRPHQALGYLTPQQFVRQWQAHHAS
jgi:transposase InsO family protein